MEYRNKYIEWMCTQCGKKERRLERLGRPMPGVCKGKNPLANGKMRPHTWVKNREM